MEWFYPICGSLNHRIKLLSIFTSPKCWPN